MKKKIFILILYIIILQILISGCVQENKITPTNNTPIINFTYTINHNTSLDGATVIFHTTAYDQDNDVLKFLWDFDDGETSTDVEPIHEYVFNGTYTVTLIVNDTKDEVKKTDTIVVGNIAPVAAFTWSVVNLTVTFTDASTDINKDFLIYSWDFDEDGLVDNNTAGPITYTYKKTGSYNVTLTVMDSWGLFDTNTQLVSVKQ